MRVLVHTPNIQVIIRNDDPSSQLMMAVAWLTRMFREKPEIYQRVVRPYIESFPADRLNW